MPYTINSHASTDEKPCINKGFHAQLTHRKVTLDKIVPGPLNLFHYTPFIGHKTINLSCATYVSVMDPKNGTVQKKKKMLG